MRGATKVKIAVGVGVAAVLLLSKKSSAFSTSLAQMGLNLTHGLTNIIPLSQSDPRWANDPVGNSTKTYADVGCVATALTITVNALRGADFVPPDLRPGGKAGLSASDYTGAAFRSSADALSKMGVQTGAWLRDMAYTPANQMMMRDAIEHIVKNDGIALVRVDYDLGKAGDNHTIVCFGYSDTEYACVDPAGGKLITLDKKLFVKRTASKNYYGVGVLQAFV